MASALLSGIFARSRALDSPFFFPILSSLVRALFSRDSLKKTRQADVVLSSFL